LAVVYGEEAKDSSKKIEKKVVLYCSIQMAKRKTGQDLPPPLVLTCQNYGSFCHCALSVEREGQNSVWCFSRHRSQPTGSGVLRIMS